MLESETLFRKHDFFFINGLLILCILISPTSSGRLTVLPFSSGNSGLENHPTPLTIDNSVLILNDRTMISLPSVQIQGQLITSDPLDACEPIKPPPMIISSEGCLTPTWILLTTLHDSCGLTRKIYNADKAGYHAIIAKNIGANNTGRFWIPTESPLLENTVIYVGVVGESDGNFLRNYSYPSNYFLKIEFKAEKTAVFYVLVIGGTFILLLVAILLIKLLCTSSLTQTNFNSQPVERYQQLHRAIQKRIVRVRLGQMPTRRWSQTTNAYDNFCAICLEDFECSVQNPVRIFICSHAFHAHCIDPWIINEKTRCPTCMKSVFSKSIKLKEPSNARFSSV